jgi:phenylacetate-CoA ligase
MKHYFLKLPYTLKYLLINFHGYKLVKQRYNSQFHHNLKVYIEHDYTDSFGFNHQAFQAQIAQHPYYKDFINQSIEDFPIINKAYIKAHFDDVVDSAHIHTYLHTSGTTGSGLTYPVSKEFLEHQWAIFWKFRHIHGLTLKSWWANIIGKTLFDIHQKEPPFWLTSHPTKQLIISSYHLKATTFESYMDAIQQKDIQWLHAYPSVLNTFANLIMEHGLIEKAKAMKLSIITTSSEKLLDYQKARISEVFGCPIRQLYGLVEGVANIFECEEGTLHIDESYSYVELIPLQEGESDEYKIVGTSYHNPALPLIRYDTGDTCRLYEDDFQCPCGRKSRIVKEILGREEDYLILSDGTQIGRLSSVFKSSLHIKEAQIYQNQPGVATFRVVKDHQYTINDEKELIRQIKEKLGKDFEYEICYYNQLPKGKKGKLQLVINEMKTNA